MFRSTLLAAALVFAPAVHAQQAPTVIQNGPDIEFVCGSSTGAMQQCHPKHHYYKRYMRLANWRFVGSNSAHGSCALGKTYGYGRHAVWVSGSCTGIFRAPDLRYGDSHNAQRAANDHYTGSTHVASRTAYWRTW